jgi:hypothetical protein
MVSFVHNFSQQLNVNKRPYVLVEGLIPLFLEVMLLAPPLPLAFPFPLAFSFPLTKLLLGVVNISHGLVLLAMETQLGNNIVTIP